MLLLASAEEFLRLKYRNQKSRNSFSWFCQTSFIKGCIKGIVNYVSSEFKVEQQHFMFEKVKNLYLIHTQFIIQKSNKSSNWISAKKTLAFLNPFIDIMPFKSNWIIHPKLLHIWILFCTNFKFFYKSNLYLNCNENFFFLLDEFEPRA